MSARRFCAVLFDLDDTLYEERQYFRSGFSVIARSLQARGFGNSDETCALLEQFHHNEGRQKVLQKLAVRLGFPADWIPGLVDQFREHVPEIQLASDSTSVLQRLRANYRLGCVTDGWHAVQQRKTAALGVESLMDAIVFSDELGRAFWKPDARPFLVCCERLGVRPQEAVFVGDNPERDIAGAHAAGLYTVRLRRTGGYFGASECSNVHATDTEITSLEELPRILDALESAGPLAAKSSYTTGA